MTAVILVNAPEGQDFMKEKSKMAIQKSENSRKIINFNGNLIAVIQANNENINISQNFPRLEYGTQDGLAFFYCKSGKFYIELTNGKRVLMSKNILYYSNYMEYS